MSTFRLALAQMRVVPGRRDDNLCMAVETIAAAAEAGAAIVLLPETLDLGWCHASGIRQAGSVPDGETFRRLRDAAEAHRIHVCAGLVERDGERCFNSAVLISPQGELLLHHRKINELAMAHHLYACGDRIGVVQTPLGTIGVMICADGFAPHLAISRSLGLMGAQVILSPCAWAVPPGHDNAKEPYGRLWLESYAPVAKEFGLWIAAASNVGPVTEGEWSGHACIGCSLVMRPDGESAVRGPYGIDAAELLFVDIDLTTSAFRADGCTP